MQLLEMPLLHGRAGDSHSKPNESKADSGANGSATISPNRVWFETLHSYPEELSQDEKDYYLDTLVTKAYMFDMVTGLLEVPSDTIGGIHPHSGSPSW